MTEEELPPKICDLKGCVDEAVTNLDGRNLCQEHANAWVRAEGQAAHEDAEENARRLIEDQKLRHHGTGLAGSE